MLTQDINILRANNEEVGLGEIDELVSLLEQELKFSELMGRPGIGLACPQIGINKKAAIIRIPSSTKNFAINLVNAQIKNCYKPLLFKEEGCLSFPNNIYDTTRYAEIHVINNAVEPHAFVATGLIAVAIQHELDHLNGILFMDRAVEIKTATTSSLRLRPNDVCGCGSGKKYKRCCRKE